MADIKAGLILRFGMFFAILFKVLYVCACVSVLGVWTVNLNLKIL